MVFKGICLMTGDVPRLRDFYAALLETGFEGDDTHADIRTEGAALAIYDARAAERDMGLPLGEGRGVSLSFAVLDVDGQLGRVQALSPRLINPPTTWPWGARSMQFLDPDGNIVTFYQSPKIESA